MKVTADKRKNKEKETEVCSAVSVTTGLINFNPFAM